jgi:hypothetical protein
MPDTLTKTIQSKLQRLDSVPESLYTKIEKEQLKLLETLLKEIDLLKTVNGKLVFDAKNLQLIDQIAETMQRTMFESGYVDAVRDFAKEFDTQKDLNAKIFQDKFGMATDKELFDLVVQTGKIRAINRLSGGAIAERFIEPLKDALIRSAASGATMTNVVRDMYEYMKGDGTNEGKLLNWVKQTASDYFSFADREYTKILSDELGIEYWTYTGGLIPTSRCFCVEREGNIYHKTEFEEWGRNPEFWNKTDKGCKGGGRIADTNEENIFTYLGGYNCRHSIIPMDESEVPEEKRFKSGTEFANDKGKLGAMKTIKEILTENRESVISSIKYAFGVYKDSDVKSLMFGFLKYMEENADVKLLNESTRVKSDLKTYVGLFKTRQPKMKLSDVMGGIAEKYESQGKRWNPISKEWE